MLNRIQVLRSRDPRPFVIAVINRNELGRATPHVVSLLLESGCGFVVASPFQIPDAARLATRHIASRPQPSVSVAERIRQRMPWQRAT
ncbi:hypothetical protein ACFL2H_12825 [Planctomycetota bacterium]